METLPSYLNRAHLSALMNTELRHIEASKLTKLSAIIDKVRGWEKLLEEITRPTVNSPIPQANLNVSLLAIDLIKQQASPSLALLHYWSITGRRRPTIKILLVYLQLCQLKWAEEYVLESILKVPRPILQQVSSRQLKAISKSKETYIIDDEFLFTILDELVDGTETQFSFECIYETSNHFTQEIYNHQNQTGAKIGEGRFSSVFRAQTRKLSENNLEPMQTIAAKLLKSKCNENFLANEIKLIGKVKHESILELLGIALGESSPGTYGYICLIYPYMENGSLLDCLATGVTRVDHPEPAKEQNFISWKTRVAIALKVAKGIAYLHSFKDGPIVHRDVKTANIFIDLKLEPKLGDFTIVRQLDNIRGETGTLYSQNIMGTSVYMPPEAFRGDISIKFDTFSFGIVLLELLTGMRPFNEELEEDLLTYINEKLSDIDDELQQQQKELDEGIRSNKPESQDAARARFIAEILDRRAGEWDIESATMMFRIALLAIESRKKTRPKIVNLIPLLEEIR